MFCADGMKRTESFIIEAYLIRSIAATTVETIGFGERRDPNQATTLVLSE